MNTLKATIVAVSATLAIASGAYAQAQNLRGATQRTQPPSYVATPPYANKVTVTRSPVGRFECYIPEATGQMSRVVCPGDGIKRPFTDLMPGANSADRVAIDASGAGLVSRP